MKSKCPTCRKSFSRKARGRPAKYCSPACRQKAYRKRASDPRRHLKALFMSDLYQIRDLAARQKAAVKVLEEMSFEVDLRRLSRPLPKRPSRLRVVYDADAAVVEPQENGKTEG